MHLFHKVYIPICCLLVCLPLWGEEKFESFKFVEPISSTEIVFPEIIIRDSSDVKFLKLHAETPESAVYVYSMENPNSCPYSWERINQFEEDFKPGRFIRQSRLPEGTDGWTRYYSSKASNGSSLVKALTLVRGNAYALYIYEIASDSTMLVTPDIAKTTTFREITGKRIDNDGKATWRTWVFLVAFLIIAAIIKLVWRRPGALVTWCIIIASVAVMFLILYFVARFNFFLSGCLSIATGAIFYPILSAKSWDDFFDKLDKIIKN